MNPAVAGLAALLAALAFAAPWAAPLAAATDDAAQALFLRNAGPDGRPVQARVGPGNGALVRSAQFACAGCHGPDARGRSEGGLAAPAIDWHRLTKPWGHSGEDGRRRAAYDEEKFHLAVTAGKDASGNELDSAMPRYELTRAQSASLFEMLRRTDRMAVPGVTDDAVLIGYPALADGSAALAALRAELDRANKEGGAYGRELRPVAVRKGDPAAEIIALVCPLPTVDGMPALPHGHPTLGCQPSQDKAGPADFRLLPDAVERLAMLGAYARRELGIPPEQIWNPDMPLPRQAPYVIIVPALDESVATRLAAWPGIGPTSWLLVAAGEPLVSGRLPETVWPEAWRARTLAALPLPPSSQPTSTGARLGRAAGQLVVNAVRSAGRDLTPERVSRALSRGTLPGTAAMPAVRLEPGRAGLQGIQVAAYDPDTGRWSTKGAWFEP